MPSFWLWGEKGKGQEGFPGEAVWCRELPVTGNTFLPTTNSCRRELFICGCLRTDHQQTIPFVCDFS